MNETDDPFLNEMDDEMRDLLEKLDENTDDQSPPFQLETEVSQLPSVDELKPSDVRKISYQPPPEPVVVEVEPPIVDMRKQFEQLEEITNEILQGARSDRQETQDAIVLLRGQIDLSIKNGGNPARMYVDNLVKALEVKAQINITAVKAIEAKAKMLAATKAGTVINNQITNANANIANSDKHLIDILAEPLRSEDEY